MATVERIEAVNPTVNAIVAMDVDAARKAARESDERRAANAVRGPRASLQRWPTPSLWIGQGEGMRILLCAALAAMIVTTARAQLAPELPTVATIPPVKNRVYVADLAIAHIADGKLHVVDGDTGRYLGLIGLGFAGQFTQSPDHRQIYVATTYLSRLQRGERADVVEVYDAATLKFTHEIQISPKRAQALEYRGLLRTSSDGRLLYAQNATPATSVTVVDLADRQQIQEIAIPGCWGIFPAASHPRRFSTICGDGRLATFTLTADGTSATRQNSDKLFDPDADALFIHGEQDGDRYRFVSFLGNLVTFDFGGDAPKEVERWSLVNTDDAKEGWRPGGYQPLAYRPSDGRLYVGMHDHGAEGSHKNPAKAIWIFDVEARKHIATMPGHDAIALTVPTGGDGLLYIVDGAKSALIITTEQGETVRQELAPIGDTPIEVESN